jgi:hypothetical protein
MFSCWKSLHAVVSSETKDLRPGDTGVELRTRSVHVLRIPRLFGIAYQPMNRGTSRFVPSEDVAGMCNHKSKLATTPVHAADSTRGCRRQAITTSQCLPDQMCRARSLM